MPRYFTDEHEWIDVEDDIATVGITDYAQGQLGDVVFVELPDEGKAFAIGDQAVGTRTALKLDDQWHQRAGSARTERDARSPSGPDGDILVLSPEMRVKPGVPARREGEILTEGFGGTHQAQSAPILDEVALRGVINSIVREELQGEMGDRISRNLRKLIRQELSQMLKDERGG